MKQPDHYDDELDAIVRKCARCSEWWPLETGFYPLNSRGDFRRVIVCRACRHDQQKGISPTQDAQRKREARRDPSKVELLRLRDRERRRREREDPERAPKLRAMERESTRRWYYANREKHLARRREIAAIKRGGPPTPGMGRPIGSYQS